jgi:hypothetical protein
LIGSTATFTVAATACTPLAYQWYFNRSPLIAQTNSTLVLSNLNSGNAGNYFAVATASGGNSTSTVATLTVTLQSTTVTLFVVTNNPGGLSLGFTGPPGSTVVLEAASNLASPIGWLPVTTNTLDINGASEFTDVSVTNFQQRFYRLKLVP